MKVAVYYNNNDVRIEEMPMPKIGDGEILVKVLASGICGSDCLEWYRIKKAPLVLGHEIAGEVVELGKGVEKYKIGDRVFVSHHVPCNTCHYCLKGEHTACETLHTTNYIPGGFSEYIRVPSINVDRGVFLLPDEISFEEGSFIEPLACVVRGQRVARADLAQSVLIIGGGISGILHLLLAKSRGCGKIIVTDLNEYRLEKTRSFGADAGINASGSGREDAVNCLRRINNGRLADLVIVCAGALSAFYQAIDSVDKGGTVLFFAPLEPDAEFSLSVDKFWRNGINLATSYGGSPLDIEIAIELIRTGRVPVKEMITHRLSLEQAPLGFKLVAQAKESLKVVIEPHKL